MRHAPFLAALASLLVLPSASLAQLEDIQKQVGFEAQRIQQYKPDAPAQEQAPPAEVESDIEDEASPMPLVVQDFYVREVKIEGAEIIPLEELKEMAKEYEGKKVTIRQLRELAKKITQHYRLNGYVTSKAVVPPQQVRDETVLIKVQEGKIGAISVEGSRYFDAAWLRGSVRMQPGDVIHIKSLQSDVSRLSRHQDRDIRAILLKGEEPETTDIVLNVEDRTPYHFDYSFDNLGSRTTGRIRQSMNFRHTSLLGKDDVLFTSVVISEHGDSVSEVVNYSVPLDFEGQQLIFSYSHSDVEIGKELRALRVKGGANNYGLTYLRPVMENTPLFTDLALLSKLNLELSIDGELGFDLKEVWSSVNGIDNSRDHLRVFHFAPTLTLRDRWGTFSFRNNLLWGLSSFLGANVKSDSRSNREGAGGQFFIDEVSVTRLNKFWFDGVFIGKFKAQMTNYRVVSTQQFRAGGADSVRGYNEGDASGDYGFSATAELRLPAFILPEGLQYDFLSKEIKDAVQLVTFFDMGKTYQRSVSFTQDSAKTPVGVGVGFRVDFPEQGNARLDLGIPIGDKPGDGAEKRIHFSMNLTMPHIWEKKVTEDAAGPQQIGG